MIQSDSVKSLADALCKAQAEIKGAVKDTTNPFFKSKYADLASVVEAIREPLAKNGLSYIQVSHERDNAAAFETRIFHSSGEWVSCGVMSVPVNKADAQGFGSSATYCRRYSLSAAFGVAPEDDDGNAASKAAPKKDSPNQLVEQELSMDALPVEVREAIRKEAKAIEGDFYTISAKTALLRWNTFKSSASESEIDACWKHIDSKVRSGIKKAGEAIKEAA